MLTSWSLSLDDVMALWRRIDADALMIDQHGNGVRNAIDDAVAGLALAAPAATALSGGVVERTIVPERMLAYIGAVVDGVSAAMVAIQSGDEEMALGTRAAEVAAQWNLPELVEGLAKAGSG